VKVSLEAGWIERGPTLPLVFDGLLPLAALDVSVTVLKAKALDVASAAIAVTVAKRARPKASRFQVRCMCVWVLLEG